MVSDAHGVGLEGNATRVSAKVYGSNRLSGGRSSVELELRILLPDGRSIIDYLAGVGDSEETAINDGLVNFTLSTFHVVYRAFLNAKDPHIEEEELVAGGEKHQAIFGPITWRGAQQSSAVLETQFRALFEKIPLSRGTHWVKIVYGQAGDEVLAKTVTMDSQEHPELSAALERIEWPKDQRFYMLKQFFVIK